MSPRKAHYSIVYDFDITSAEDLVQLISQRAGRALQRQGLLGAMPSSKWHSIQWISLRDWQPWYRSRESISRVTTASFEPYWLDFFPTDPVTDTSRIARAVIFLWARASRVRLALFVNPKTIQHAL
jgi:hypothetical protein